MLFPSFSVTLAPFVVLGVRHDLADVNTFSSVVNDNDNSVVVSRHIENYVRWNIVCRVKKLLDVIKILEVSVFDNGVPLAQSGLRSWMPLPEVPEHLQRYDVHAKLYHIDINRSFVSPEADS
jgi:hypothetical protein